MSFKIDQTKLGDTDFNDLLFLWYDEDNYQFVEIDTNYDETNSLVSIQTTHFSRYMVVDKYQWFEAWAVEFDYNPGAEGTHGEPDIYHNTVLAIDCSGSMDSNDRISIKSGIDSAYEGLFPKTCQRIEAATEFIRNMNSIDKTAVVLFTSNASTAQAMTDNKENLKLSLQNITSNGGTSFYAALTESYNAFEENTIGAFYTNNRIILLSDGEDGSYSSTLSLLHSIYDENSTDKRKSIKIFTIGLGSSYDSRLEEIANISHGEFFKAYTADELVDIYTEIGIGGDFDTTDTDGDKLYDAVETAGIRIQNGQIFKNDYVNDILFTDPTKKDTDNDGLEDGEEIDPTIRCKNQYWAAPEINVNSRNKSYYFFMKSNPNDEDTDGDGLLDGKRIFDENSGKVLLPIDDNPRFKSSYETVWKKQKDIVKNGVIPTDYTTNKGNDNKMMNELSHNADSLVDFLLNHPEIANKNLIEWFKNNFKEEANGETAAEAGADFLDFIYDNQKMAYHSQIKTWQKAFGYNDIYDKVFDHGSNMLVSKISFVFNEKEHILWSWKGDYWNLGSGSETGLYVYDRTVNNRKQYDVVNYNLPMTLALYNVSNDNAENIFIWNPSERQWWVTGFNPKFDNPDPDEMQMICSVNFIDDGLYKSFVETYRNIKGNAQLLFDDENHTVWIMW